MPKSSKSFLFLDVNVWVALTYDRHVHHESAKQWLQSLGSSVHVFFCRVTQLALLRLLTTEAVMGKDDVLSQVEAWDAYDRWIHDERVSFLPEPPELELAFRALSRRPRPAPKDWADSYLAAFASASNLTLVTFDGDFRGKVKQVIVLEPQH